MINITITQEIQDEYIKTIKEVLLTPKTKKFTAKTKRFFKFLKKDLHISRYSQVVDLFINNSIQNSIKNYGVISTDEENYDIYNDFRQTWAKKLVNLTNIKVCPYCNRNFIVNFDKNKTTVELDHYYPKNNYPYLAISLYNLIPSCHTCNHKKHRKKLKIYPYKESINDYIKFSFTVNKLPFKADNIDLLIIKKENTRKNRKKINNYEKVFNISTLYENHKDIVSELLQKKEIYSDSYIDDLMKKYEGTLFKNREDLLRLITCGYVNDADINKRPLSKLIKDISEELGLK
ncbi:MAG: HNH endonuclease [Sulfurimonas sp.]|nr:HNH endonuclease [Sulfurimonas sp.]